MGSRFCGSLMWVWYIARRTEVLISAIARSDHRADFQLRTGLSARWRKDGNDT